MKVTQYWIHQLNGNKVQLIMDNIGSMSFIIPVVKFKKFISDLEKFDGRYLYTELNPGVFFEVETDYSEPEESPEANINYYINNDGVSMCVTFHCFVSDVKDMAINLANEMCRTDGAFSMFTFKHKYA